MVTSFADSCGIHKNESHFAVSNATVLQMARFKPCSAMLQERQAKYLEALRGRPVNDPGRQLIFDANGEYRRFTGARKVGRPRITWLDQALVRLS